MKGEADKSCFALHLFCVSIFALHTFPPFLLALLLHGRFPQGATELFA
jgi:hypothetical protein